MFNWKSTAHDKTKMLSKLLFFFSLYMPVHFLFRSLAFSFSSCMIVLFLWKSQSKWKYGLCYHCMICMQYCDCCATKKLNRTNFSALSWFVFVCNPIYVQTCSTSYKYDWNFIVLRHSFRHFPRIWFELCWNVVLHFKLKQFFFLKLKQIQKNMEKNETHFHFRFKNFANLHRMYLLSASILLLFFDNVLKFKCYFRPGRTIVDHTTKNSKSASFSFIWW